MKQVFTLTKCIALVVCILTPNLTFAHTPDLKKDNPEKQAVDAPMYVLAATNRVCVGDSIDLKATCYTGTVLWYDTPTGTNLIGQGTSFKIAPITNGRYYAACYHDFQESSRVATQEVQVFAKPTMPNIVQINQTKVCRGTEVQLTGSCTGGTLVWYRSETEADSMGFGNSFNIIPEQDTRYYGACYNGVCTTNRIPTDSVMVLDVPDAPTQVLIDRVSICSSTPVTMTSSCASGGAYWYDSPIGGSVLDGGTQSPEASTTYYGVCINQMCESPRVPTNPVEVIPQPELPTYVVASKYDICLGESITLSATCTIGTASWYQYPVGVSTFVGSGNSITVTPDTTTTYYASCENGACISERIRTNEVRVNEHPSVPNNVTVDKAEVCGGSPVILSADFGAGTLKWYTTASGGTAIGTGNNLSHSPTITTIYYAACENGGCSSVRVASAQLMVKPKPDKPTITGTATICSGESIRLVASINNASGTCFWTNGATGLSITVSPAVNTLYRVCTKDNDCTSDSSEVFSIVVNPTPAAPNITTNTPAICKGGSAILTGQSVSPTDNFYWSTPTQNMRANASNNSTRLVTEPGIYKGWSESAMGCRGPEKSIVILQSANCNGQTFIIISPEKPTICPNTTITLTATGCNGAITWTDGNTNHTGTSIKVSPLVTTTYMAQCSSGGLSSKDVVVAQTNTTVTNHTSTGIERIKAILTLESSKKIGEPDYTPAPNVSFEAGNSITLKPGFVVEKHSVFSAVIKGCG
ncbi:3-coathanger stack domain-containing protein [Emticicia sp. BO119]|uniref:immunoglobulin domain-containing protein n=1 Tax=Emticicia sp. BO119 TaxID=2757768 RepID=UPI0015F0D514|nr:3-coathanger stack domain-containing protein [Emticicia sp. BO119]MBA4851276.1 hypothetical protein [Emticicia sp. BO119]